MSKLKPRGAKRQKKTNTSCKLQKEGSNEEVLRLDVQRLISTTESSPANNEVEGETADVENTRPERFSEIDVEISSLSSTGDGLGLSATSDHVYVVPFTLPGDLVRAKVIAHFPQAHYTLADFVRVITPSQQRDDTLIKCPYFARCSGCQFQMLAYPLQLAHKKTIVERAYANFSDLAPESIPQVGETIGSPMQYGYRTKLTPHFDGPPSARRDRRSGVTPEFKEVPPIGFMQKGTRRTLDIEDCPIGTDAVREGMRAERERVRREIASYRRGATLLLRESTERIPKPASVAVSQGDGKTSSDPQTLISDQLNGYARSNGPSTNPEASEIISQDVSTSTAPPYTETKTCIADPNATATEYVDGFAFTNTAGAFFQNNNSILPRFTAYIRDHILPSTPPSPPITHLVDAYCGSGLFTVTLSSLFTTSIGIDIASPSIAAAQKNAALNNIQNATFHTADAAAIFAHVVSPPEQTAVVIDPPRKGCDESFLKQLLRFGPRRVVYVSCNVHTQARDVGMLVEGIDGSRYTLENLRGFDFFPQTGHVEGVAILERS